MPKQVDFKVALRLTGDDLIPSQISRALNCEPSEAKSKGDEVESKRFIRKAPTGVWLLQSPSCQTIDEAINYLLDQVSNDAAVWADLNKRYHAEFFIGVFSDAKQFGVVITPETLKRLSRFGLSVSLDIYCNAEASA